MKNAAPAYCCHQSEKATMRGREIITLGCAIYYNKLSTDSWLGSQFSQDYKIFTLASFCIKRSKYWATSLTKTENMLMGAFDLTYCMVCILIGYAYKVLQYGKSEQCSSFVDKFVCLIGCLQTYLSDQIIENFFSCLKESSSSEGKRILIVTLFEGSGLMLPSFERFSSGRVTDWVPQVPRLHARPWVSW